MKIQSIGFNYASKTKLNSKSDNSNKNSLFQQQSFNSSQFMYNPAYLVSFSGDSINLGKAVIMIKEKEAINGDKRIPARVEHLANKVLSYGNPNELRLIDIHKMAYNDIKSAESISQIRDKFPEFRDVKSIEEIAPTLHRGSFLKEMLEENSENYFKDKDISLELMNLYWADGLSLDEIEKQTGVKSSTISSVMKSLQIPLRNFQYANIMKLSDPKVSQLIAELAAMTKLTNEAKEHGGIVIPNVELTQSEKDEISKALLAFYIENPDKAYAQTKSVKSFYRENPEKAEVFSALLNKAWSLSSSKQVLKELSSFYIRNNIGELDSFHLALIQELSPKQEEFLQKFWQLHPRAKKDFVKSMKSAIGSINKRLAAEQNNQLSDLVLFPKEISKSAERYFEKVGRPVSEYIPNFVAPPDGNSYYIPITGSSTLRMFLMMNPDMDKILATAVVSSIMYVNDLINTFKDPRLKPISKEIAVLEGKIRDKGISTADALVFYSDMCKMLKQAKKYDILNLLNNYYKNGSYNHALKALNDPTVNVELVNL